VLTGTPLFEGAGLFFVTVRHTASHNKSTEEAEPVLAIVERLLATEASWTDADGQTAQLTTDDVLIVSPYNAQVALWSDMLPQCRAGTVDKFQGQQAPVVVYSMTNSSARDTPRSMRFLYNANRLNVASSRARCASIVVACSDMLEPQCHSPQQMKWASGLCRYHELAKVVDRIDGN
jgi:uncharacterized protein